MFKSFIHMPQLDHASHVLTTLGWLSFGDQKICMQNPPYVATRGLKWGCMLTSGTCWWFQNLTSSMSSAVRAVWGRPLSFPTTGFVSVKGFTDNINDVQSRANRYLKLSTKGVPYSRYSLVFIKIDFLRQKHVTCLPTTWL